MTTRYKPYLAYQESGVEWLGKVPEGWEVKPLKHFSTIDSCGCYGSEPNESGIVLPVATTAQIDTDGRFSVDRMPDRGFTPAEVQRYGCASGDILVVKSSGSATNIISGKSGIVDETTPKFIFSNFLMRVRPNIEIAVSKFVFLLLKSHLTRQRVELMCSTTTYPNLQVSEYSSSPLPIPPLSEQLAIAAHLDRETTRIDGLVEKKTRFIELLREKRQALITHAVTKGLDPHAKMKDSGVEWLGEVPEHWEVKRTRQVVARIESGTSVNSIDVPASDQEYGVLKTSCVSSEEFCLQENKAVVADEYDRVSCQLKIGALIVSRMNTPDLVGSAGLVRESRIGIFLPDRLWQMSFCDFDAGFAFYWTKTTGYRTQIRMACTGTSSSMQNMSQDQFLCFTLPAPPLIEQNAIVAHLDPETTRIDSLIAKTERSIELLKERRAALITAAVTGQIDLREAA